MGVTAETFAHGQRKPVPSPGSGPAAAWGLAGSVGSDWTGTGGDGSLGSGGGSGSIALAGARRSGASSGRACPTFPTSAEPPGHQSAHPAAASTSAAARPATKKAAPRAEAGGGATAWVTWADSSATRRRTCAVEGRSTGSLASISITSASSALGTPGASGPKGGAGSLSCRCSTSASAPPSNGPRPASSFHATTPSA